MNLTLALCPKARHCLFFAVQVRLHLRKLFDDRFYAMSKLWAGEILVDELHFRFLSILSLARIGDFNQRLPKSYHQWDREAGISNPDTINLCAGINILGKSTRYQHGDFGICSAQIRA
jgi:hypothetical protein